jgi:hypothetical protein
MNATPPLVYVDLLYTPKPEGYEGRWQPWRAMVLNGNNFEPLFMSTEAWTNRDDAMHTIWEVFGPGTDVYLREAERGDAELRMAQTFTEPEEVS